jgi:hypothetical protein
LGGEGLQSESLQSYRKNPLFLDGLDPGFLSVGI